MQSCDQSTLSDSNGAKLTSELTNINPGVHKRAMFSLFNISTSHSAEPRPELHPTLADLWDWSCWLGLPAQTFALVS